MRLASDKYPSAITHAMSFHHHLAVYSGCGGADSCLLSELIALYCPGSSPSIVPLLTTMFTFWTSSGCGQTGFGHRIRSFILTSYALLATMYESLANLDI